MVTGVSEGYSKELDIVGVGYRAELKGKNLFLTLATHTQFILHRLKKLLWKFLLATQIKISGIDKELVGLVAAKIRSFRKPEPYKGKGIKYSDETIIKKAGKTAGA
jgi:large subunit ribosomal protein L6